MPVTASRRAVFRIGLTGGVGSGKSTVASVLHRLGAGIVDADSLAHELTGSGGAAIDLLRAEFGDSAIGPDGALDRAAMRALAFADPAVRQRLEAVLHPLIRANAERRARALAERGAPYIVFVVPLLVESAHWHGQLERVLVVDCSEAVQLERVAARPGLDRTIAARIVAAQASRASRLAAADDVLFNEAPLPIIETRVAELHSSYLALAASSSTSEAV